MSTVDIIQRAIDHLGAHTYLEIGAAYGTTFLKIRARRKIAVDPFVVVALRSKIKWSVLRPCNLTARYYRTTSDEFFSRMRRAASFDVVFIDGLHTYQQALKDIDNALTALSERGVILVHDCNPPDAAAAHPADSAQHAASLNIPGWSGDWYGDVWKAIVSLRCWRQDLRVSVLDSDCGIGVITKGRAEDALNPAGMDLDTLTYAHLASNRERFLNLKKLECLEELLD